MILAEMLVDHNSNVNALNEYGETPLHYASRRSKAASVQMLLQRGADSSIKSSLGDTALDEAGDARCVLHLEAKMVVQNAKANANGSGRNTNAYDLSQSCLLLVFRFLGTADLCRSACVNGRWHRTIEEPSLWKNLGVRRWELALAASMKNVGINNENLMSVNNINTMNNSNNNSKNSQIKSIRSSMDDAFTPAPMGMFRVGGSKKKR